MECSGCKKEFDSNNGHFCPYCGFNNHNFCTNKDCENSKVELQDFVLYCQKCGRSTSLNEKLNPRKRVF